MLIELFCEVMAEALYERMEIGVSEGNWSVSAKFSSRPSSGHPPRTICARIDRPVNAVQFCRQQYSY